MTTLTFKSTPANATALNNLLNNYARTMNHLGRYPCGNLAQDGHARGD